MLKNLSLVSYFERVFFQPSLFDWVVIVILSPLSLLYALVMLLRRFFSSLVVYPVPVISIGNLMVGGSGKTPFTIALASRYSGVYIITRGYGRKSKGLVKVSNYGEILTDVFQSGDEPMLMAKSLPNASVVVSEDRHVAIDLAIKEGAGIIFLDDGFNRTDIKKFDILLSPQTVRNYFPLPAGPFREFYAVKACANLYLVENQDFERIVQIINPTERMILATAISNPKRLEPFLPKEKIVDRVYLEDHAYFDEQELLKKQIKANATSFLITQKDQVKMEGFKLPLSVMELKLKIKNQVFEEVNTYIENFYQRSKEA